MTDRARRVRLRAGLPAAFLAVTVAIVGAAGIAIGSASPAAAAPIPTPTTLRVVTVPPVPGAQFALDGRVFAAGIDGVASIDLTRAARDALAADRDPHLTVVTPDVAIGASGRARFAGWWGTGEYRYDTGEVQRATFETDALTSFSFADPHGAPVEPSRISSLELDGSTGARVTVRPPRPTWLRSTRIVTGPNGPVVSRLTYAVRSVTMRGSNVVNRDQQRFVPAQVTAVHIRVLLFDVVVQARDAFLGSPIGSALHVTYPDGSIRKVALDGHGEARLTGVPRGAYELRVDAAGLKMMQPVAVSRNQVAKLRVLSYVDVMIVLLLALVVAGLLFATGLRLRRRRRRRLAGDVADVVDVADGAETEAAAEASAPAATSPSSTQLAPSTTRSPPSAASLPGAGRWPGTGAAGTSNLGTISIVVLLAGLMAIASVVAPGTPPAVASAGSPPAPWSITVPVPSDPTSPATAVSSTTVSSTAVSSTAEVPTRAQIPVLAYYYIWYTPSSWRRAKSDLPLLGRYGSDDRAVMEQHVRWAKAAGITGLIVSWKHTPDLDRRLATLADVAEAEGLHLSVIYQGLDFHRKPLPVDRVRMDLAYFADHFASRPAFSGFSKPLVIWSGTWKFSRADIAAAAGPVRDRVLVLASERNAPDYTAKADVVDGDAYYWSAVNPATYPGYEDKLAALASAVHDRGGLWIAPAAPGFDARLVGGTTVVGRAHGATFEREMDAALASSPDALGIISWNEFSENSGIEPSRRYGSTALAAVAARFGDPAALDALLAPVAHDATLRGAEPVASVDPADPRAQSDPVDSSSPGGTSPWGIVVLALVAAFVVAVSWNAYRRTRRHDKQLERRAAKRAALAARRAEAKAADRSRD